MLRSYRGDQPEILLYTLPVVRKLFTQSGFCLVDPIGHYEVTFTGLCFEKPIGLYKLHIVINTQRFKYLLFHPTVKRIVHLMQTHLNGKTVMALKSGRTAADNIVLFQQCYFLPLPG